MNKKELSELGGDSLLSEMEQLEIFGGGGFGELQRVNVECTSFDGCSVYGKCDTNINCTVHKDCQIYSNCS